jgi:hypothetical protein
MAAVNRLLAGIFALAHASCGGGGDVPLVASEESSVSPLLPGMAGAEAGEQSMSEGAPAEPLSCDPAECPEVLLFGVLTPGCCRFGNLCGGRVQVSERTWACLAPEVNEQGEQLRNALARAARDEFEPSTACPSHTIDGDELLGCCRAGVCGVDTQPWTRSAAAFGLVLPRACLDPREAAELAEQPASSRPPPRCRD